MDGEILQLFYLERWFQSKHVSQYILLNRTTEISCKISLSSFEEVQYNVIMLQKLVFGHLVIHCHCDSVLSTHFTWQQLLLQYHQGFC